MSASLPALKDISAGYLTSIQQTYAEGLHAVLIAKESTIRATLQARVQEICAELPQLMYDAATSNIPYVDVFCVARTEHTGLCADGVLRETNSEAFERYLCINAAGNTVQEILTDCLSTTLTITPKILSSNVSDGSFLRCFRVSWPVIIL